LSYILTIRVWPSLMNKGYTVWQHKVFFKLLGLQYKIIYKQGSENRVVDALFRRIHDTDEICMIFAPIPQGLQKVQDSYTDDANAQGLTAELSLRMKMLFPTLL
jgi:hypothetical protein